MLKNTFLFVLLVLIVLSSGCAQIEKFNAVEGKVLYEEHYATFDNVNYESGETETFGASITNKRKYDGDYGFDWAIFPDVTFESSKLKAANRPDIKVRRLSAFLGARGTFHSFLGTFDINLEVGPSYVEAYNDSLDTSKVEPTFRYEGVYTLFVYEGLYTAVSFTFQESPSTTYSEYYSLMYKLGYKF